ELVVAVGHAGGGHRVGDEGDVLPAGDLHEAPHEGGVQVGAVGDELDDEAAVGGGGEELGDGAGLAVVHRVHPVAQVGDRGARGAGGGRVGEHPPGLDDGGTRLRGRGDGVAEGGQRATCGEGAGDAVLPRD